MEKNNISEDILGKIDKKVLSSLADFGHEVGEYEEEGWIR